MSITLKVEACSDKQQAFLSSEERMVAYIGGIGCGKSTALVLKALMQPPNSLGCIVCPTYTMMQDTIFRTFLHYCKPPLLTEFKKSDLCAILCNGSEIMFRSADNPERLRGSNLSWIALDEAALMTEEAFDILIGRLRVPPMRMFVATTPKGKKNWVYRRLVQSGLMTLFRAESSENKLLPREYLDTLGKTYSSAFAQQELKGLFVDLDSSYLNANWIKEGKPETLKRKVVGVDLAISTKQTADFTALVCIGYDGSKWYIIDAKRGRWSFNEQLEQVKSFAGIHGPDSIDIEQVQYQAALIQELCRSTTLNVRGIKPDKDKATRFAPVIARYEQGLVYHDPHLPLEYTDELTSFPNGDHDDFVDATSLAFSGTCRGIFFISRL